MSKRAVFDDWINEARAVSVATELHRRGLKVEHEINRPCPAPGCGGTDRFAVNLRKGIWICRATGAGGDTIALCQHLDGTSFMAAVETLTGRPPPGRDSTETEQERLDRELRLAAAAEADSRKRNEDAITADRYREAERRRAHVIWRSGRPITGTPVVSYLNLRGLVPGPGLRLRYLPSAPLWDRPAPNGKVIHQGPAMLAPIVGPAGRFAGVHQTWIDLADPDGKARVPDADGELLPAKKIRGSKRGGHIELGARPEAPTCLFFGEGIETVLSVRQAIEHARPQLFAASAFWSAVDLLNLAGRSAASVPHPTLRKLDSSGRDRAQRVPGPIPADTEDPPIPLPDSVVELVLLGDGDSEPVRTSLALERARARFWRVRPELGVRIAMAPAGHDFNDLIRERAA